MKLDLSFIPENILLDKLKRASQKEISIPYGKEADKLMDEAIDEDIVGIPSGLKGMEKLNQLRENYWTFEMALLQFANDLFQDKEYELAEKCCKYLITIKSKLVKVKELLIKIYIKTKDDDGFKFVRKIIDEHLNESKDYHYMKAKVSKLKAKYQKELDQSKDDIWACLKIRGLLNLKTL